MVLKTLRSNQNYRIEWNDPIKTTLNLNFKNKVFLIMEKIPREKRTVFSNEK